MYRGLLSRMLVAALLVAVIAKPCLGLLSGPVHASGISIAATDETTVSGNKDATCNRLSLSARIEENDVLAIRPRAVWSGSIDWAGLKAQSVVTLPYLSHAIRTSFSSRPVAAGVLRRLAVLERFLL